jgi:glycine dehydrogenase
MIDPLKPNPAIPEDRSSPLLGPGLTTPTQDGSSFADRHIGPRAAEVEAMLGNLGCASMGHLVNACVPATIRLGRPLQLPEPNGEHQVLEQLRERALKNRVFRSFIGMGYSDCITPPVIQRNLIENPGWYTQYTPYQAEIAQGRLEALLVYQTMITSLTALEIANASLLDEATAAAEAMTLSFNVRRQADARTLLVMSQCHPQTIAVIQTRARPMGITVKVVAPGQYSFDSTVFAGLVQYPGTDGIIHDFESLAREAHQNGALFIVAADLLGLTLMRPPGEFGADVVVGSAQRFGVPLGYGGPHAAFLATRDQYKRHLPGRLVGVSHDSLGRPAYRLALQTREQHIRREKATSNICTAQVLLAIAAAAYAVYHGPAGLKQIAQRIHRHTQWLARGLRRLGYDVGQAPFFDTLQVPLVATRAAAIEEIAARHEYNLRRVDDFTVGISLDETTTANEVLTLLRVFNNDQSLPFAWDELTADQAVEIRLPDPHARQSPFLQEPVFHRYQSETEMLRYLKRLESRDLSLTTAMIPLGSCTMKLNAAAEMLPLSWPEFARLHPFAPEWQSAGYQQLFRELSGWLAEITGLQAVSLQPNAGSQGEYAGLLVIRAWHESRGQRQRNICLIPQSAHGTNPASAVMAGFTVVPVACDPQGNVDVGDLKTKANSHAHHLAALMITYPSTHGVFEEDVAVIARIVHEHGGLVYMDGANMNAQVGLCRPGDIGADVCHLNLHKTFSIPHGGGGPGMAPIAVKAELAPFLPRHPLGPAGSPEAPGPVSEAPWGSASILVIPWAYIAMMGGEGLTRATQTAILNANYIAMRLERYYPVLYRGKNQLVAHECILDFRGFRTITVDDVAKRLMDYGFHAPTISWPVPNTMMVEPTESESKQELDRFCEAMIAIHAEIMEVESGRVDPKNNLLKNAPHPAIVLASDPWDRPYSRERAAFPVPSLRDHKFWPAVGRVDNVFGDRNLVCTCAGVEAY